MPLYRGSSRLKMVRRTALFDASTVAWVNAVVAAGGAVSSAQKGYVDKLIRSLKAHNYFFINDRIWLHANADGDAKQATIDIINLAVATNNGCTLAANQGYTGDAVSTYIDTNYSQSASSVNYVRDSASYSYYVMNNRTTNQVWDNCGLYDAASSGSACESFTLNGGNATISINETRSFSQNTNATTQGFYTAVRTAAAVAALYKNENTTALVADTNTSTALVNLNFFLFATNQNGTGIAFSGDTLAISTFGAGLSSSDAVAFQHDLNTYMHDLGTAVY